MTIEHNCDDCGKAWDGPGERWHVVEVEHGIVRRMCDRCYNRFSASSRDAWRASRPNDQEPKPRRWR